MIKTGTSQDETLVGGSGNDTLDGGTGNDYLVGEAGNDTYNVHDLHTQIYDSSGTDRGVVYVDFYKTHTDVENWTWAAGVQKLPYWIDALLPGSAPGFLPLLGGSKTMYYAFPTAVPSYFSADDRSGFQAFNASQKAFVKTALAYISSIIDIQFVETANPNAPNVIAFVDNVQESSAGYAYYPYDQYIGSDVLLDSYSSNLAPADGSYSALTYIHEIGHALGLKHPFSHVDATGESGEAPFLSDAEDSTQWTVMSYTSREQEYHLRYSPFDIAALQYLYGPSTQKQTDDIYTLHADSTNFIWDGGGADTIDGSALTQGMTLYLTAGYRGYIGTQSSLVSSAGQVTVNFGTTIENAKGGAGSDIIVGNVASNHLYGGAGDDTLTGGVGDDTLDGGTGIDTAVFSGTRSNFILANTGTAASYIAIDRVATEGWDTLTGIEKISFTGSMVTLGTVSDIGLYTEGTSSRDILQGTSGQDIMLAGDGNDIVQPGVGNDYVDGGAGLDTVIQSGTRTGFTVSRTSNDITVTNNAGLQGSDWLQNVERVVFDDAGVAFDIDGNAGQVYRLYQAAFDRSPDLPGLGFWMSHMDKGMALSEVSFHFQNAAEFASLYGNNVSNTQLVMLLYQNVLHRAPNTIESNFWVNILETGQQSRAVILTSFSESPENQAQLVGVLKNGMDYIPYTG